MRKSAIRLIFVLVALPGVVQAVTHEVTVGDNFFSPNDLTINVGDTVRWSYSGSRQHDVTADDFSWGSQTSSSFTYERTFNSAGEVLYHCTVHSSPGRDINVFQNGRLEVVETDGPTVAINAGMSDAWYNPATNGQGFLMTVWEASEFMFLAWFTYDTERPPQDASAILGEPGHRWITAQGPYLGDTAELDVFLTSGGVFDAADPPADTDQQPIGTITITWDSCAAGTLVYDMPGLGLAGEVPIQRIVPENAALCEAGQAQQ
jgi:plastocyanin